MRTWRGASIKQIPICQIPYAERMPATESGDTHWPYLTTGLPVTNCPRRLAAKFKFDSLFLYYHNLSGYTIISTAGQTAVPVNLLTVIKAPGPKTGGELM